MLSCFQKAPISLHFDDICQLLLLLSSLITVNYSPFYVLVIYSGSLFVGPTAEQHGGGLPVSELGARPGPFN